MHNIKQYRLKVIPCRLILHLDNAMISRPEMDSTNALPVFSYAQIVMGKPVIELPNIEIDCPSHSTKNFLRGMIYLLIIFIVLSLYSQNYNKRSRTTAINAILTTFQIAPYSRGCFCMEFEHLLLLHVLIVPT